MRFIDEKYLKKIASLPDHVFAGWSRGEKSRPIRMRFATVRKEIVFFGWPYAIDIICRLGVTAGRRVQQVETASVYLSLISVPINNHKEFNEKVFFKSIEMKNNT